VSTKTTLFRSNRSQTVRLPPAVAFKESVRDIMGLRDGPRRIIVPVDASWDDFFDAPGVDLGEREQLEATPRDSF
jgi:antitoxin VapB